MLGMCYLSAQGQAELDVAAWLEQNGLIEQTEAGAITAHCGHLFPLDPEHAPEYVVSINQQESCTTSRSAC